ncbi:immunity protein Imm33 domain-containing protein [Chryseobacterium indologenes]|uniref:immunity protein Imm33 domain-containing protein n=1 Tax=Chryseobacterium indologenes TaxID=253 RepID=UPI0030188CBF
MHDDFDSKLYKDVSIRADRKNLFTDGLSVIIGKEVKLHKGSQNNADYLEVIKYLIDYCVDSKPIISENQNIGYYSWLLQFRLDEENYYDLYEANSDGSDFNKGCDTAISVVREQSEVCWQQNLIPLFPNFNQSVVISDEVYEGKDIEGIRYDSPQDESGWYLITDDYNDDIKSLKMVHFYHVAFARPDILQYLAIPFGYRFIMKNGNIEIHKDEEE